MLIRGSSRGRLLWDFLDSLLAPTEQATCDVALALEGAGLKNAQAVVADPKEELAGQVVVVDGVAPQKQSGQRLVGVARAKEQRGVGGERR